MAFHHEPVMPREIIEYLRPGPGGVFADGTLGGGGHSALILENMGGGTLYGIDRDPAGRRTAGPGRFKPPDRYPGKGLQLP